MNLEIFNYEGNEIRTTLINNEPWFVGKDVAEILGYKNTKDALISHIDKDDKKIIQRSDFTTIENYIPKSALAMNLVSADVPNRGLTIINESGLYSLILSSKLEGAKKFKKWVTSEVLPTIRKHGAYMTNDTLEKALTSPEFLIQLATNLKIEKEKNKMLTDKIETDRPKVIFAEALAVSEKSILIGELAKILKQNGIEIGANRLFEWLRANNYLMAKGESRNQPSQKSMNLKLMEIKKTTINNSDGSVRVTVTTKITPKGQEYFINKFLKGEIV